MPPLKTHIFVDATFGCVPKPFKQCLILMVYDPSLKIYIPVYYVLMTGKSEKVYDMAYMQMDVAADEEMDPSAVGVDFETALLKMAGKHFPDAVIVGCDFHWKQALRRKLKAMGFPDEEIEIAMRFGMLDLLISLPPEELERKGLPFVRNLVVSTIDAKLEDGASYSLWDGFFDSYFIPTWMKPELISVWNKHGLDGESLVRGSDLAGRCRVLSSVPNEKV